MSYALTGARDTASEDEALLAFGLVREEEVEEEHFALWPENVEPMQVFIAMQRQIRVSPGGQMIGFDYTALDRVEKSLGITIGPELFRSVQVMEDAACGWYAEH